MRKTDIRAACLCLNLPTPLITRQVTVAGTATNTVTLQRTMRAQTVLPKVATTTTLVVTNPVVVTAPSPIAQEIAYTTVTKQGCPPGKTSTWMYVLHGKGDDIPLTSFHSCPGQTGDNDGSDPNYQSCAVVAQDNYQGKCLYWSDGRPTSP